MLYIIGTGLTAKSISLEALEIIRNSKIVYIDYYTSKFLIKIEELENVYGVKITIANRNLVERSGDIVDHAKCDIISFLVIGTPLFATTHTDIINRAKQKGIKTKIIHNSSIMNVMGSFGLYSYGFGRTVSIPFYEEYWKPTSFYRYIHENLSIGLHTLVLLDIQAENKLFMDPKIALTQLLYCESVEKLKVLNLETKIITVSRFGDDSEVVHYKKINDLLAIDYGEPLHSMIIPAKMDEVEKDYVDFYFK